MLTTASKVAIGLGVPVGVYAIILGTLMTPYFQRFALYANKFNTLFYHDVNNAEQFGFAKGQVTPFNIRTPDGETLYAWHVLPLNMYARNQKVLRDQRRPSGPVEDFESTTAFSLLSSSANARVVVSFHGNAGHVAQGWRTDTFRYLITQPNTHVLTIDYRGFGYSTGSPTEAGLITDGVALVNWILEVARIPPERVVILGQSLGTAVASAVGLNFVDEMNALLPRPAKHLHAEDAEARPLLNGNPAVSTRVPRSTTAFAGIILVAPFSNLPSLLLTYRLSGIVPLLLPLRPFPFITKPMLSRMVDQWPTADRLAAYYQALSTNTELLAAADGKRLGSLQILHATNDMDISYHQTEMIVDRIFGEHGPSIRAEKGGAFLEVVGQGKPRIRVEIGEYGGHNRIVTYAGVGLAVLRAFEDV